MALDLTQEQKQVGRQNFEEVAGELSRRGFMKSVAAAGAIAPVAAATYFGYESIKGKPVKAALIGCGDEGGVLLGEHNPEYLEFIAACDIRPFNQNRILEGDPKVPLRKGFRKVYGNDYTDNIKKNHVYTDYKEMLLKEKDIEAVVIALPLHLHASVSIDCMKAGKHVLCEKLMARTIAECKEMIKVAKDTKRILSIGHQRHYSMLYQHASEAINAGMLGDIKHIRALWHRNFSWSLDELNDSRANWVNVPGITQPYYRDGWYQPIMKEDFDALNDPKKLSQYGYESLEELIRWRLFNRTGGGLMAELGSHQLDAASIFLGKVKPLAVTGVGTKSFFGPGRNDRTIDDHVFVTFEFPGKNHPRGPNGGGKDASDVVVVTYSSISTNGFEPYGETIMGSRGTMIVESEQSVMLYKEPAPGKKEPAKSTAIGVTTTGAGKPALDAGSTWGGPPPAAAGGGASPVAGGGPPGSSSRGYREEMEDFAFCIRKWDAARGYEKGADGKYAQRLPRCHGEVAMADAILALTSNLAMKNRKRIDFDLAWFDSTNAAIPDKEVEDELKRKA
jgi:predicted dehydrogenase